MQTDRDQCTVRSPSSAPALLPQPTVCLPGGEEEDQRRRGEEERGRQAGSQGGKVQEKAVSNESCAYMYLLRFQCTYTVYTLLPLHVCACIHVQP